MEGPPPPGIPGRRLLPAAPVQTRVGGHHPQKPGQDVPPRADRTRPPPPVRRRPGVRGVQPAHRARRIEPRPAARRPGRDSRPCGQPVPRTHGAARAGRAGHPVLTGIETLVGTGRRSFGGVHFLFLKVPATCWGSPFGSRDCPSLGRFSSSGNSNGGGITSRMGRVMASLIMPVVNTGSHISRCRSLTCSMTACDSLQHSSKSNGVRDRSNGLRIDSYLFPESMWTECLPSACSTWRTLSRRSFKSTG